MQHTQEQLDNKEKELLLTCRDLESTNRLAVTMQLQCCHCVLRILENTRDECINLRAQLESLKSSLENETFTRIELQSKLTREVSV